MTTKVWHPTARVQIVLRVDAVDEALEAFAKADGNKLDGSVGRVAQSSKDKSAAIQANRQETDALLGRKDTTAPDVFKKEMSNLVREREQIYATAEVGSNKSLPTDPDVVSFWVIPDRVSIEKNNIYSADKATVDLAYRNLPFDPRAFRFAAVRILIGSPSPEDIQAGITGGSFNITDTPSIVPPETTRWYELTGNSRFVGFVDEWTVEFDDGGEKVTLRARDLSSVLRDQPLPEEAGLDLDKPIRRGIEEMLRRVGPATQDIRVVYGNPFFPMGSLLAPVIINFMETVDGPVPRGDVENLSANLTVKERELQQKLTNESFEYLVNGEKTKWLPEVNSGLVAPDIVKAASKAKSEKKKSSKSNPSKPKSDRTIKVWEQIRDICTKMGLIPLMRGNVLFIASARDMYAGIYGLRQMVWGGNIESLKFSRKSTSQDDSDNGVQLVSPNPRTGRELWARFPVAPGEPASGVLNKPGSPQPVNSREVIAGESKEGQDKFQHFVVGYVPSEDHLRAMAEEAFNIISRQEIAVSIETSDLSSFANLKSENGAKAAFQLDVEIEGADLLAITSGDAIEVETLRTASGTPARVLNESGAYRPNNFLDISAMTPGERKDFYVNRGFRSDVAEKLATSQEIGDVQRTFRVNHATIDWQNTQGVSIKIDAINFIESKLKRFLGEDDSGSSPSLRDGEAFV